ncbi:type II toxin-antitoxin system VapC family toxin [Chroococcidiopsis sp.]|uniref:type II toxin-antitoxin system VapC family toxin n=1 Tax=Chroococcidiopsis sp. TaxID=3088168 RepID=UPI003F37FB42
MPFLADTNLLLRSVDPNHPMNTDAVNAINRLRQRSEQIYIVPQNLIEFWNVYKCPLERNGLGRTAAEAEAKVNRLNALVCDLWRVGASCDCSWCGSESTLVVEFRSIASLSALLRL